MEGLSGIDLEHASGCSASDSIITHRLWLNNTPISPPSFAKNLNLNISSSADVSNHMKQPGQQLHDQDSSSTQSTGQSHQGVIMRAGNVPLRFLSAKSCGDDMDAMDTGVSIKSILSLRASETTFSTPKVNFSESDAGISCTCRDPFLGGSLAAYGSHGIHINTTQVFNNAPPGRVPLPYHQLTDDGPIYVNAKQYHGILRRRQQRAKLAALNKLVGIRKPYLHESRHRHAMRRIRGPGGRFLNTKQLQQLQLQQQQQLDWQCQQDGKSYVPTTDGNKKSAFSAPSLLGDGGGRLWGFNLQMTNAYGTASGDSSASDITNVSNPSDTFELAEHAGFTEFLGGTMYNGSQTRVPVFR